MNINEILRSQVFAPAPPERDRWALASVMSVSNNVAQLVVDGDVNPLDGTTTMTPALLATPARTGDRVVVLTLGRSRIVIAAINAAPIRTNLTLAAGLTNRYAYIEAHAGRAYLYLRFQAGASGFARGAAIATIPAGLRPSLYLLAAATTHGGLGLGLTVSTNGIITLDSPDIPPNAYVTAAVASWAL